ncbi:MAG TPA: FAD:protein FMN transferase [Bacteroidales bacterium]|nr:FAD:protein FMN transferase [Bacteroidales bacterium]HRZ77138.1 FAD:protein FMN transferase [Bacteroidales bacterium]
MSRSKHTGCNSAGRLGWFLSILLMAALGCQQEKPLVPVHFQGEAQGTYYALTYYDAQHRNLQPAVDSLLRAFDLEASLWVEQSTLSQINRNDTSYSLGPHMQEMLQLSLRIARESQGAFDITVGPLVNAWGFGFREGRKPQQATIDSLLQLTGAGRFRVEGDKVVKSDARVELDLNAIAQGYSVDLLGAFLEEQGIQNFLVDIGGEVLARGKKADGSDWRVGIERPAESPDAPRELQDVVRLTDLAMATSGSYRKFYEQDGVKYSHTIDPATGYPVTHRLLSASVMAGSVALADAYATVLMVLGPEKAKAFILGRKDLEAYLIFTNEDGAYETWVSPGLEQQIVQDTQ